MSACCPDVGKISVQENEAAANRVKMLHFLCQWKTDPCPTSHQSVTWASSIHLFSPNTLIPSNNQSHTELLSVELLSSSWTCPLVLFHSLCYCHCPDLNYNLSTRPLPFLPQNRPSYSFSEWEKLQFGMYAEGKWWGRRVWLWERRLG